MANPNNTNSKKHKRRKKRRLNWKAIILVLSSFIIFAAVVAAVVILIINAGNVKEVSGLKFSSTTSSVTLTWKQSYNDASYEIQKKSSEDSYEIVATISPDQEPTYTELDLPSATLLEYKIISVRGRADSPVKSEGKTISGYTIPEMPSDCHAMTQSKNSLTVSFIDEQKVAGYEIKYSENENFLDYSNLKINSDAVTFNQQEKTLNYIIENLVEGKSYYFSIRSFVTDKIYSEWTEIFNGRVTRAIDMTGVDPNKPMVAITYDDGPGPGDHTQRIIEAFKKVGGRATFFQLGNRAESYSDQMNLMVENGHEIGCHTYDHKHAGSEVNKDDIIHGNNAIENSCGVRPTVFRSPGGNTTDLIKSVCADEGMPVIQWNVDTRDWKSRDAASVCEEIKSTMSDGNIILMHNIYESTATATEQILPWIVEQGYQLVTVSQLIQAKTGAPPTPGLQYYTATKTK